MSGKFHASFAAGDVNLQKTPSVSARFGLANVRRHRVQTVREINSPRSIGPLHSAFTDHAGRDIDSGEYRLVGLTPCGEISC